jgi:hypothetical protein
MRLFMAALLGGVVMFLWGFVAHMLLPVGDMGLRTPTNEDAVLAAVRDNLPGEGVYVLPWLGPDAMKDTDRAKAYAAKVDASPYAWIVYQPQARNALDMSGNLAREFATNLACAAIVAFLMLGVAGFGRRLQVAALMGLFGWLAISVPYWNWYRFPLDFTLGSFLEQVVGWALAGAAMAWWLGRRERIGG